jgi:hypothetical protein
MVQMKKPAVAKALAGEVGTTGFEPAASCTPCKRGTGLRYVPNAPSGLQIYDKNSLLENGFNRKPYLRAIPYR